MALSRFVRQFLPPNTTPPRIRSSRTSGAGAATAPDVIVLKLGEGNQGIIVNINYSIDIQTYMTKQQRELQDEE